MAAIEAHLGYTVFGDAGQLRVHGNVERRGATLFRAEVELLDAEGRGLGRRGVEAKGSECSALNEALVLVLSLAIDAQLLSLAEQMREAPEPEVEAAKPERENVERGEADQDLSPAPAAEASAHRESQAARREGSLRVVRSGSSFGLVLSAGAGLGVGLMPSAAWNTTLTLGWRTASAFAIELAATFFPYGRVPTSDGRAEFRAGYVELRGCGPLYRKKVLFDACVGLWNGALQAQGTGFSAEDLSRVTPLSGATAQVRAAWDFWARCFLRASVGVGVPFVRDRFVAESTLGQEVLLHRLDKVLTLVQVDAGVKFR